jgi:hypothetical protein
MAHQLPRSHANDTSNASILDPSTTSLLNLPAEIVLGLASHLDKYDIKALRSTCTYMDTTLLDTFAKEFFSSIYVMPNKFTLDALIQISQNERIRPHVRELNICCSIYQNRETASNIKTWFGRSRDFTRKLKETEMPIEDPATPEEEITNEAVDLVRRGGFEALLVTALRGLKITRIEIHEYKWWTKDRKGLKLGRLQLIQQSGTDIYERGEQVRAWEYASPSDDKLMDMVTCMTSVVLTAFEEALPPIFSLVIPRIQIDRLRISPSLGSKLTHLQDLNISISVSHQEILGQQVFPSSPQDLLVMVNDLPNLHTLRMSSWPVQHLNHYSLPLYPFLQYLRPLGLKTLHLHSLCDTSPLLAPFLSALPLLQTLSLDFVLIQERENKPWRDMFLALKGPLSRPALQTLVIEIEYNDAFQLASRFIRTGSLGVDGDPESEYEEKWMPGREEMLDCLAGFMPDYHPRCFERRGMGHYRSGY